MDDRIAKLKTAREALSFAGNARRLGHTTLAESAMQRAADLRAAEEGFVSPAEQAIATALYAYEEQQSRLKGRAFRASRTRQMLSNHGPLAAAERIVLHRQPSKGYEVLEEAGLEALSFEAIIDRFPEEFSIQAREAARARLQGKPAPSSAPTPSAALGNADATLPARYDTPALDAEAVEFFDAFKHPPVWFLEQWLPRYRRTVTIVADGLARQQPDELFAIIWKHADNSVSHAGLGLLRYETVDELRAELVQVIQDIEQDGGPEGYRSIVSRFESWKDAGLIGKVPRLLIARAFAAIHPHRYHTTVDAARQNEILKWFSQHTGFAIPTAGDWASRAQALTEHLDTFGKFGDDIFLRNVFPWFVIDRLTSRASPSSIPPGHSPRPLASFAHLPPEIREIELRHNALQTALFAQLATEFGEDKVWTEYPIGDGCFADAIARLPNGRCHLYEIKTAATASLVIREAMGQLLEYGFRQGGLEPVKLYAVGEPALDPTSEQFLARLRGEFSFDVGYLQITLEQGPFST